MICEDIKLLMYSMKKSKFPMNIENIFPARVLVRKLGSSFYYTLKVMWVSNHRCHFVIKIKHPL